MFQLYGYSIFNISPIHTAPTSPEATSSVLNDGSFRITWSPPSPANGVLTQYYIVVYNTRTGYRQTFTKRADDSDLTITLDNLSECIVT